MNLDPLNHFSECALVYVLFITGFISTLSKIRTDHENHHNNSVAIPLSDLALASQDYINDGYFSILNMEIQRTNTSLSQGQMQLLCMARMILQISESEISDANSNHMTHFTRRYRESRIGNVQNPEYYFTEVSQTDRDDRDSFVSYSNDNDNNLNHELCYCGKQLKYCKPILSPKSDTAQDSRIVVIDEGTSSIDPVAERVLMQLLTSYFNPSQSSNVNSDNFNLASRSNPTLLLICHKTTGVSQLCNKVSKLFQLNILVYGRSFFIFLFFAMNPLIEPIRMFLRLVI
jgi:hypothetical protein